MGLSQEGLGERLGVSRQAIYKWESDTSLPEIDKLITLSKIFSLPVGWLLGVEQAAGRWSITRTLSGMTGPPTPWCPPLLARPFLLTAIQFTRAAPTTGRFSPCVTAHVVL